MQAPAVVMIMQLDHVTPGDELTHDTKAVGGCKEMLQYVAMHMFGCRLLTAAVTVEFCSVGCQRHKLLGLWR